MSFFLENYEYEKWCDRTFNSKVHLSHTIKDVSLFTSLDIMRLSDDDFYKPSKANAFKRHVGEILSLHEHKPDFFPLDDGLMIIKDPFWDGVKLKEFLLKCNFGIYPF